MKSSQSARSERPWLRSPRVRARPGYNDDGSKTLRLEIPGGVEFEPGE